eukprot:jgi/Bigna1/85254/estExt_fgenesh1_pg.C_30073
MRGCFRARASSSSESLLPSSVMGTKRKTHYATTACTLTIAGVLMAMLLPATLRKDTFMARGIEPGSRTRTQASSVGSQISNMVPARIPRIRRVSRQQQHKTLKTNVRSDQLDPLYDDEEEDIVDTPFGPGGSYKIRNSVFKPTKDDDEVKPGREGWDPETTEMIDTYLTLPEVVQYFESLPMNDSQTLFNEIENSKFPMPLLWEHDVIGKILGHHYTQNWWEWGGRNPAWFEGIDFLENRIEDRLKYSKEAFMSKELIKYNEKMPEKDKNAENQMADLILEALGDENFDVLKNVSAYKEEANAKIQKQLDGARQALDQIININPKYYAEWRDPNITLKVAKDNFLDTQSPQVDFPWENVTERYSDATLPSWVDPRKVRRDENGRRYLRVRKGIREYFDPEHWNTAEEWKMKGFNKVNPLPVEKELGLQGDEREERKVDEFTAKLDEARDKLVKAQKFAQDWKEALDPPTPAPTYPLPTPMPTPIPTFEWKPINTKLDTEIEILMPNIDIESMKEAYVKATDENGNLKRDYSGFHGSTPSAGGEEDAAADSDEDKTEEEGEDGILVSDTGSQFGGDKVAVFSFTSLFEPDTMNRWGPELRDALPALHASFDQVAIVSHQDPFVMAEWAAMQGLLGYVTLVSDPNLSLCRALHRTCSTEGHGETATRFSMILNDLVVEDFTDGGAELFKPFDESLSSTQHPASAYALLETVDPDLAQHAKEITVERERLEDERYEEHLKKWEVTKLEKMKEFYDTATKSWENAIGHYERTGEWPEGFSPDQVNPDPEEPLVGYKEPLMEAVKLFSPRESRWDSPFSVASPDTAELSDELVLMESKKYIDTPQDAQREAERFWHARMKAEEPFFTPEGKLALGDVYWDPEFNGWAKRRHPGLNDSKLAGAFEVKHMAQIAAKDSLEQRVRPLLKSIEGEKYMRVDYERGIVYDLFEGPPGPVDLSNYKAPEWAIEMTRKKNVEVLKNRMKGLNDDGTPIEPKKKSGPEDDVLLQAPDWDE